MSAFRPRTDIGEADLDVRKVRQTDSYSAAKKSSYSITSSARARSAGGMLSPSDFAVLRFITKSNLVGCSTGRSAGFVPLRILSTYPAARRDKSARFAP